MGFKKPLFLFLILIGCIGYYYFFETKSKEEKGNKEETRKAFELKKIFTTPEKDFIDIRITRGSGEKIHYQRNSKGWQMVEPQIIQGDESSLEGLIESLRNVNEIDSVIDSPLNLSDFGLDKPSFTIEIKAKGSVLPRIIFLGSDTPTRTTIYAKTSDSPRVFIVGSLIRWEVDKEFDNLKNRRGPFFK